MVTGPTLLYGFNVAVVSSLSHLTTARLSSKATSFAERRHVDGLLRFGAIQEDEEVKEKRRMTLQKL